MQPPPAVDQRAVVREELDSIRAGRSEGERRLADARGKHDRDRSLGPNESDPMEPRELSSIEVLADPGENELIDGLVDDGWVVALNEHVAALTVENGYRTAEVLH